MVAFTAVRTTGIYCQPGCSARPLRENTLLFDIAAAAEAEGFRPCLRCRPYRAAPPVYTTGPSIVCRAVGMILDGVLDSSTEAEMADRLAISARHLRRLFQDHLGVTPNELARSSRAHFARRLLDDTDLMVTEIGYAAGFGSVRQMNRVFREIFRSTPTQLRAKRRRADRLVADGGLPLRLPFDGPFDWEAMMTYLQRWAIPGVEHVTDGWYRRTVMIEGDPGVLEMRPLDSQHLLVVAHLPHWEGLIHVARRAAATLGLTVPTDAAREHLADDPTIGPLVRERPGVRVPGSWSPFETAVVALLAQEMLPAQTRSAIGDLTRRHGTPVPGLRGIGLSHTFPEARVLAHASLAGLEVSERVRHAIRELSAAVERAEVSLDPSQSLDDLISALLAIPGIEQPVAHYVAYRLGFRDAFPMTRAQLLELVELHEGGPRSAEIDPDDWRPWRSLATAHLLTGGELVPAPGRP